MQQTCRNHFDLLNKEAQCEARLALDTNGFSCLTVTDASSGVVLSKSCTDSGWDSESTTDPRDLINNSTGYQVNAKFVNEPQMYFSSWMGGAPRGLPQRFITLKKQAVGFRAADESILSTHAVFCDKMQEE